MSVNLEDVVWSYTGCEDLRKYCRSMSEFCRDVASIIHDRSKLEASYADGLTKLANRARKSNGDTLGSLHVAWESFATTAEEESEIHRSLSVDLLDDLVKPIKAFVETQKEGRKQVELLVDKANKQLSERRQEEIKVKKNAFRCSKDTESLTIQLEGMREKSLPKDLNKLDSKCKKAEENVIKADKDRIKKLIEAERSRLNLDASLSNCCKVIQTLEEERVKYIRTSLLRYCELISDASPKLNQCCDALNQVSSAIDVQNDTMCLIDTRGSPRQPAEQIIFDCFEGDLANAMDAHRRHVALELKLEELSRVSKAEKRARAGLAKLSSVYQDTPNFSDPNNKSDVTTQLRHASAVIDCLDASCYNVLKSLSQADGGQTPSNRFAAYITETKDKTGMLTTVMRLALDQQYVDLHDDGTNNDSDYVYAALSTHTHDVEYVDGEDDDFDDVAYEEDAPLEYSMMSRCRVNYEYLAARDDELTITENDIITITCKLDDGWWEGELGGKVGIFPASYVEEI